MTSPLRLSFCITFPCEKRGKAAAGDKKHWCNFPLSIRMDPRRARQPPSAGKEFAREHRHPITTPAALLRAVFGKPRRGGFPGRRVVALLRRHLAAAGATPRREVRRAAVFALGFLGDFQDNHSLGCALVDEDRTVRTLAENSIRCVWMRTGTPAQRRELDVLIRLLAARQFDEVIRRATRLLEAAPAAGRGLEPARHRPLRPGPIRRNHPRLPRGPGVEPLSLHRGHAHGAGLPGIGQPGVGPGVFSPGVAAESRPGRRAASGRPAGPPGRGALAPKQANARLAALVSAKTWDVLAAQRLAVAEFSGILLHIARSTGRTSKAGGSRTNRQEESSSEGL